MRATKRRIPCVLGKDRRMPSLVPYGVRPISTNALASRRRIAQCSMPGAMQSRGPTVLHTAKQSTAGWYRPHILCPRDGHASIVGLARVYRTRGRQGGRQVLAVNEFHASPRTRASRSPLQKLDKLYWKFPLSAAPHVRYHTRAPGTKENSSGHGVGAVARIAPTQLHLALPANRCSLPDA